MAKPVIKTCLVPEPVENAKERKLYRSIRDTLVRGHCADKRPSHKCLGRVTITRDAIVLQCPRCGDAKNLTTE